MGLPKVWVRSFSDGLIRADHIIAISTHPTPELSGKSAHWLLDATLAVSVGSGNGSDGWAVAALHRTLIQTREEPVGAADAFAQMLAALHDTDAAGIIRAVADPAGKPGLVRFEFTPFATTEVPKTTTTTSEDHA
ncbi:hypothetical protein HFP15_08925 [Amycolatopsis sp. K13G38]|uniref:Uncharacterized protein n=1 Tax=Amycolatopsis acididurans TaxID=2724524 RepID=A0ABX1J3X7_9PSEU|nr:hypothetical protein [Amycolatopsis acididurans]NKQ53002.1 hypothetical protein [Amycolatopsis acididurans]